MSAIEKFNELIDESRIEDNSNPDEYIRAFVKKIDEEMTLVELEEIQDIILENEDYSDSVKIAFTTAVFNKTTKNISSIIGKIGASNAVKSIMPQEDPSSNILLGLINFSCFVGLCFLLS